VPEAVVALAKRRGMADAENPDSGYSEAPFDAHPRERRRPRLALT
jgi:hypothetical protein